MKKFNIFILIFLCVLTNNTFANNQTVVKQEIMVGYYGRPNIKSLGILGQNSIDDLIVKMRDVVSTYNVIEGISAKPTFHIIYDLATLEAGRDGDFIKPLGNDKLMEYIEVAQREDFAVIIDLQLGANKPVDSIKKVLKYLKYDNVHLAIDPEFKVPSDGRFAPGRFIGHVYGKDVNQIQKAMDDYIKENGITTKRTLIVHMFTKRMLRKKQDVKNFENVNLVYNIDGHGMRGAKMKIYNSLYKEESQRVAKSGFKIFYKNDKKPLLTPRQILGIDNMGPLKLNSMPVYINYQ